MPMEDWKTLMSLIGPSNKLNKIAEELADAAKRLNGLISTTGEGINDKS